MKVFADYVIPRSYKKFQVEGTENIPTDGSVIWAANHTNALMDPLVLLAATHPRKVYVARADIFKKPFIIKALTFMKIMPIYRIRDGFESVKRNDEIIERAVDVLADGVPLCIFPEATHRPKHSLLKLSKGIFHIACSVHQKNPSKPVYILPVGIDYGDFFRYHSTVLVRFGKPFNVSEYMESHSDLTLPVQMQQMRGILTEKMSQLIPFVPDNTDYDAVWEYAKLKAADSGYFQKAIDEIQKREQTVYKGLMRRHMVDRYAIEEALKLRESNPENTADLFQKIDARRSWRIQNGVSVYSIVKDKGLGRVLWTTMKCLIGLPYYLFSLIIYMPLWVISCIAVLHITDDAFYNSARFIIRMLLCGIVVLLWSILFLSKLPLLWALAGILLMLPGCDYMADYTEHLRVMFSDWRWMLYKKKACKV